MATFLDVAKHIIELQGEMSAMKLQKLMFYAQAWSLVWDEEPLFDGEFEAWANGPVLPSLYQFHKGKFKVDASCFANGKPESLSEEQRDTIDKVLEFYGNKSAQWLSNLTHQERPWLEARNGVAPGEPCKNPITLEAMEMYYSGI